MDGVGLEKALVVRLETRGSPEFRLEVLGYEIAMEMMMKCLWLDWVGLGVWIQ